MHIEHNIIIFIEQTQNKRIEQKASNKINVFLTSSPGR